MTHLEIIQRHHRVHAKQLRSRLFNLLLLALPLLCSRGQSSLIQSPDPLALVQVQLERAFRVDAFEQVRDVFAGVVDDDLGSAGLYSSQLWLCAGGCSVWERLPNVAVLLIE